MDARHNKLTYYARIFFTAPSQQLLIVKLRKHKSDFCHETFTTFRQFWGYQNLAFLLVAMRVKQ